MEAIKWVITRNNGDKKTVVGHELTNINGKSRHAQAQAYASKKYPIGSSLEAHFETWINNNGQPCGFIKPE